MAKERSLRISGRFYVVAGVLNECEECVGGYVCGGVVCKCGVCVVVCVLMCWIDWID